LILQIAVSDETATVSCQSPLFWKLDCPARTRRHQISGTAFFGQVARSHGAREFSGSDEVQFPVCRPTATWPFVLAVCHLLVVALKVLAIKPSLLVGRWYQQNLGRTRQDSTSCWCRVFANECNPSQIGRTSCYAAALQSPLYPHLLVRSSSQSSQHRWQRETLGLLGFG